MHEAVVMDYPSQYAFVRPDTQVSTVYFSSSLNLSNMVGGVVLPTKLTVLR